MKIEKMSDFFTTRVDGYDEHMLKDVEGCKDAYIKMVELLPKDIAELLDLGCGTGLELDEIFKNKPFINVTGINLTQAMLDKLKQKHPDKKMSLINASYFDYDFGTCKYDVAISFQTMHHFLHEDKIKLYSKIFDALKAGGQKFFGINKTVKELGPTELVVLETKNMFMDYTFLMEDDTFIHFEFQTTNEGKADLRRFRAYKSMLSH
nr:TPA_exp: hypothetical protein CAETHG_RS19495 [Clostridium autoethanogenum DSM 10061]